MSPQEQIREFRRDRITASAGGATRAAGAFVDALPPDGSGQRVFDAFAGLADSLRAVVQAHRGYALWGEQDRTDAAHLMNGAIEAGVHAADLAAGAVTRWGGDPEFSGQAAQILGSFSDRLRRIAHPVGVARPDQESAPGNINPWRVA